MARPTALTMALLLRVGLAVAADGDAATKPVVIADVEDGQVDVAELEDYILKFRKRIEPLTLKEALDASLIPPLLKDTHPEEILNQMQNSIEDVFPLRDIMAILQTPDKEALPMLLSDIRRDGTIFSPEQLKHPYEIARQNLARLYDLRNVFFDIANEDNPSERRSINLSTALREHILPFREVADMLLNSIPSSDRILFGVHRGGTGMYLAPLQTDNMGAFTAGRGIEGYCLWANYGRMDGPVVVDSTAYSELSGCQGSLSAGASINHYMNNNNTNISGSMFGDPQGATLSASFNSDFGSLCPWYGYANDFNGFGLNGKVNLNDVDFLSALSGGAFIFTGTDYVGVGASASLCSAYGTINASVNYVRSKGREVSISKPKKKYEKLHRYRVIVADNKGSGLKVTLGIAEPSTGLGFGFNGGGSRKLSTTYKTHLSKDKALEYQADADRSDFGQLSKSYLTTDLPKLENPLSWLPGDEVVTTKSGTYYGAFIVGVSQGLPVSDLLVGASTEVTGKYELRVKRLNDSNIEVTINPTKLVEKGVFGRVLNIASANISHGVALALKQKFVFDFSGGEGGDGFDAVTAYRRLIHTGQLPNELSDKVNCIDKESSAAHLIEQFALENKALKAHGIERKMVEIIYLKHKRLAAMAGIDVLGVKFCSVEAVRAAGQRIIANEAAAVESIISIAQHNKSVVHRGESSKKAYATINKIWEMPVPGRFEEEFDNIVLTAEISRSRLSGDQHNQIRKTINETFGLDFGVFTQKAERQSRVVVLERKLNADNLTLLRDHPHIAPAILHSGLKSHDIHQFIGSIKNQGPSLIANKIREFVDDHGLHGIGAIHYLLGGKVQDIKVRTTSSIYSDPINRAEQFLITWLNAGESDDQQPIANLKSNASTMKVRLFFQEGQEILDHLRIAREGLHDEQFMIMEDDHRKWPDGAREDKKVTLNMITTAEQSVKECLKLSHLTEYEQLEVIKRIENSKRTLEQNIQVLHARFPSPIQPGDSRSSLRKRYKHHQMLSDAIAKRTQETSDDVLLTDEEKSLLIAELKHHQQAVDGLVSFELLTTAEDYDSIIQSLSRPHPPFLPIAQRHKYEEERFRARVMVAKEIFSGASF